MTAQVLSITSARRCYPFSCIGRAGFPLEPKEHIGKTVSNLCMALLMLKHLLLVLEEILLGLALFLSSPCAHLLGVLPQLGRDAIWQSEG